MLTHSRRERSCGGTIARYLERRQAAARTALKTYGVAFVRECGLPTVRTIHHPANVSAIAMNRRMGFVDAVG
ncbi:hypothetical protein GCM10023324_56980 [Streptomyces youssoufiensis]